MSYLYNPYHFTVRLSDINELGRRNPPFGYGFFAVVSFNLVEPILNILRVSERAASIHTSAIFEKPLSKGLYLFFVLHRRNDKFHIIHRLFFFLKLFRVFVVSFTRYLIVFSTLSKSCPHDQIQQINTLCWKLLLFQNHQINIFPYSLSRNKYF